ncbi:neuroepithelial cell-transforming gene 1 protein-like [Protopterus annectens]|uniref:neuroepithelial cell-transforming gene 1 protein-like n=1 Tax=Protopterus annectens TaxID=7888 RepID=UPI001CFB55DB|nr:neuroepithelial cell-transforming gene 1 protein-like [Protopterus annectens]
MDELDACSRLQQLDDESEQLQKKGGSRRKSSVSSLVGTETPECATSRRTTLRRGSSFTFLTPGPYWDFTLGMTTSQLSKL